MWQKVGFAAATWTLKCGAQWPENSSPWPPRLQQCEAIR
jgi:hypothetical protein